MADAGDSKSPDRKIIPVQVRGSVLGVKPKRYGFVSSSFGVPNVTKFWDFGYLPEILYFCPSRGSNIGDRKMGRKRNENRRRISVRERRTQRDFSEEIAHLLDVDYPDAEVVVLVMDNLNTHKIGSL